MPRIACVVFLILSAAALHSAEEPLETFLSSTFRVTDKNQSGTGFLIAGETPEKVTLITAGHVFEKMSGSECSVILRTGKPGEIYKRREFAFKIREKDKPLWKKHPDVDLVAIRLELPKDVAVQALKLTQIADEQAIRDRKVRLGEEVWIPGFPAQLEANSAGWPVLRKGNIASFPLLPLKDVKTFLVDASSFGGDSGAPVFTLRDGNALVVGVVLGMQRQTDKVTSAVEEHTTHTPIGLAIVLQAAFVRELLAQPEK